MQTYKRIYLTHNEIDWATWTAAYDWYRSLSPFAKACYTAVEPELTEISVVNMYAHFKQQEDALDKDDTHY